MFVAKVTGSMVSTQKVEAMVGYKLLVVEPYRLEAKKRNSLVTTGRTFVAVDLLGAGVGGRGHPHRQCGTAWGRNRALRLVADARMAFPSLDDL